jgi:hypothetical protein
LRLASGGAVKLSAKVGARLSEKPDEAMHGQKAPPNASSSRRGDARFDANYRRPYWNIERARIGDTQKVPVEVIVNGRPVARKEIAADGNLTDVTFDVPITQSSWVALRILPSSHTNPIFVAVGNSPIRASRKSVEWCLASVDQCWKQKERTYAANEHQDAVAAYNHAREVYRQRLTECTVD